MGLRTLRVQYVLSYQCSHEALDDVEISRGKTRNSLLHIVSREHYMVNFAPCFLPKLLVIHGLATYVVERGLTPWAMDRGPFGAPWGKSEFATSVPGAGALALLHKSQVHEEQGVSARNRVRN